MPSYLLNRKRLVMTSVRMWSCGSPCTVVETVAGKAILESNVALLSQTKYVSTLGLTNSPAACLFKEILMQAPRKNVQGCLCQHYLWVRSWRCPPFSKRPDM